MVLNFIKNTVLIFVITVSSCGYKTDTISANNNEILKQVLDNSNIKVGANRTTKYLPLLNGKQIGIVANQTSVIFKENSYTHLVDSLVSLNVNVTKIFSPEHGFRGKADAGEHVKDGVDTKTNLPILSLHGKNKKPSKEQLNGIDFMIFDIQDVGVRFYTYISTLHYVMEACAENNISLLILDRPNPNGHYIDGPTMKKEHTSFLGMHPIPLVHGMTIGEYAQMINGEQWLENGIKCDITVITIKNYNHKATYSLPIRPSPNLPNDKSIMLYPSLGLFEGTTINAGRGTEFQFQRYGAPYLDEKKLSFSYTPKANFGAKYPKHKDKLCYGEDLTTVNSLNQVTLQWLIKAYKNATNKTNFFKTASFTKHSGGTLLQQQIIKGMTEQDIKATWQEDIEAFKIIRDKYLIYE